MEEIIDDGLCDYYKAEKSLVADILDEKLNYIEARKRYKIMSEYIPINIFMNSFYLDSLMKLHYGDDPNWQNSKTYTIEIGSISYDEAVESIKTKTRNW